MAEKVITQDLLRTARGVSNLSPMSRNDIKSFQKSLKALGFNISADGVSGQQTQTAALALMLGKKLGEEYAFDSSPLRPDLLVAMVKDPEVNKAARAHMEALKSHNDKTGATKINVAISSNQIFQESGFNPRALHTHSEDPNKNSYGMYQFTLTTGKKYGLTSIEDLNNPEKARQAYIKFTAESLSAKEVHGDPILNLVAYNAGKGAIDHVRKKLGKDSITGEEWLTYMRNKAAERAQKPENLGKEPKDYPPIKGSDGKMHDQKMAWDQVTLQYVEKIVYGKTSEKPHASPATGTTTVKAKTEHKEENIGWLERAARGLARFVDKANDKTLMAVVKGEDTGLTERLTWYFNRRATQFASLVSGVNEVLHARDEQNRRETLQFAAKKPPRSEETQGNRDVASSKRQETKEKQENRGATPTPPQTDQDAVAQARALMSDTNAYYKVRAGVYTLLAKDISVDEIIEKAKDEMKRFAAEGNTLEVVTAYLGLVAALEEKYKNDKSGNSLQEAGDNLIKSLDEETHKQLLLADAFDKDTNQDPQQVAREPSIKLHLDLESGLPLIISGDDGNNGRILESLKSNPSSVKNALAEVIGDYAKGDGDLPALEQKFHDGFAVASRNGDPALAALHWKALETSIGMRIATIGGENQEARIKTVMESYVDDLKEDKQALNMLASLGVAVPKDGLSGEFQQARDGEKPLQNPTGPTNTEAGAELVAANGRPKTPGM